MIEEINQNEWISKTYKKVSRILSYTEHLLILTPTVSGFVSISLFASIVDILIGITSSAIGLKISVITAGIKKHKSIIKKKKHDKMLLLAKYKLNSV